jgi:hypothetical protein
MDEARRVLERLERIETLRRTDAPAAELLVQLRRLLMEGERWLAVERLEGNERARDALDRCRRRLSERGDKAPQE